MKSISHKKIKKAFSLIELSIVILIIGILVAGVTSSSRLISRMRLITAQSLTRSSDVNTIRDISFWVETSLDQALTNSAGTFDMENSQAISSWNGINPQSSFKINVTQSNTARQPTYRTDGINGIPSVNFNGSQILENTANMPIPVGDKNYAYVVVWRANSVTAGGQMLVSQGIPGSNGSRLSSIMIATNNYGFAGDMNDFYSPAVQANTPYVTIMNVNNNLATGNIIIYTNSNTAISGTTGGGSASLNVGGVAFAVGGRLYEQFFGGLISEVIVFDRNLNSEEIVSINRYLGKKYNIKIN